MIFYCFPRIIGRVHREGKAIHQSTAEREREGGEGTGRERDGGRERRGGNEYGNGKKDRRRQVGGKTEGEERGKEIERIRIARWRQGGDVQMC